MRSQRNLDALLAEAAETAILLKIAIGELIDALGPDEFARRWPEAQLAAETALFLSDKNTEK